MRRPSAALAALLTLACADAPTQPAADSARVTIALASAGTGITEGQPIRLAGGNGVLRVDSILLLIGSIALEPCDGCSVPDLGIVALPLSFEPHGLVEFEVVDAAGLERVRYEVRQLQELDPPVAAAVRAARPDWPDDAAALVTGTFRYPSASALSYRAYFRASFELEADLGDPRAVDFTAVLAANPIAWFAREKGEVLELSYFDYATTGRILGASRIMPLGFVSQAFIR